MHAFWSEDIDGSGDRRWRRWHKNSETPVLKFFNNEGGDEGLPIVLRNPKSEVAITFRELARSVAQEIAIIANGANSAINPAQIVQIGKFS